MNLVDELWWAIIRIAAIVTEPTVRTYWPYLLISFVLAITVVTWQRAAEAPEARVDVRTTLAALFDKSIWLHRSAVMDYLCYAINGVFLFFLAVAGYIGSILTSTMLYPLLLLLNDGKPLSIVANSLSLTIYMLSFLVWQDFGRYVAHYCEHHISFIWEFHKVHHSAQVLTPVTLYRMHPCDYLFDKFTIGLFVGTSWVVGVFVFGENIDPIEVLGWDVVMVTFYLMGANLRHSHVWISYPRWLNWIMLSPAQHQIHHSILPHHHNSNLGVVFAFWDAIFKTLYLPKGRENLTFGLGGGEERHYQSIQGMYLLPFKQIWIRLKRILRRRASSPGAIEP